MSNNLLSMLLSAGNNAFDENGEPTQAVLIDAPVVPEPAPEAPVVADPVVVPVADPVVDPVDPVPAPVVDPAPDIETPPVVTTDPVEPQPETLSIVLAINEDEQELVAASTAAAQAEVNLIDADCVLEDSETQLTEQAQIVSEVENVVASMESFIGSPMSMQDAIGLQKWVASATRGDYDQTKVVGSLEDFGNEVSTDDALSAGLEGIGDFLKAARNKLSDLRKVMVANWGSFFKEAFLGFDKVARRADALAKIAKSTSGESNSSSIQLPLDTAWRLVKDGKVSQNLPKDLADLGKFTKLVFKDNADALIVHRKKLVDIAVRLSTAEYDDAVKIAKELVSYDLPVINVCKTKVQTNSNTVDAYRSDEVLGGVAVTFAKPVDKINGQLPLSRQLADKWNNIIRTDVGVAATGKKTPKLDVAIDTLQPAEIAKLADDVSAILGDVKQYRTNYVDWYATNTDLDRVIAVLANVPWSGDAGTTVVDNSTDMDGNTTSTVTIIGLNQDIADVVECMHDLYSYLTVAPIRAFTAELLPILNRALEVGERSLATYSDNNLS